MLVCNGMSGDLEICDVFPWFSLSVDTGKILQCFLRPVRLSYLSDRGEAEFLEGRGPAEFRCNPN